MARSRKKLGEILIGWGVITPEQAVKAANVAKGSGKRLGEALVETGFAKEDQVAKALAEQFGMEYVDLNARDVSGKIDLKLIPEDLVKKHLILPMAKTNGKLQLIIHDPMNLELLDMLRFRLNTEIDPKLAARSAIKGFLEGDKNKQVRMVAAGESLISESIDKSVDRSVDRSVDKAKTPRSSSSATASSSRPSRCGPAISTSSRWPTGCACGTESTACAWNATSCPSACRTRSFLASS